MLLPMIGNISEPNSTVMRFLQSYYPGYVMGHEDHRSGDEIRHEPDVIEPATQRIIDEVYADDFRLWRLVQNGTAYYPANYRNCTAALPDGSRAVPPALSAAARRRPRSTRTRGRTAGKVRCREPTSSEVLWRRRAPRWRC